MNYSQREKIFSHDKNLQACCYFTAEDFVSESIDSDEEENLRQLANCNSSDNAIEGKLPSVEEKFGLSDVNLSSDDGSDIESVLISTEKAQLEHVMRENVEDKVVSYTTRNTNSSSPPAAVVVDVAYESPDGDSDLDDNSMQQDPQLDFNIRLQSRIRKILLSDDSSSTDSLL